MREGCVVEQGFRGDLEKAGGEWERMVHDIGAELQDNGFARKNGVELPIYDDIITSQGAGGSIQHKHTSIAPSLAGVRPVTMALAGWMFDVVTELTRTANAVKDDLQGSSAPAHSLPSPLKNDGPGNRRWPSSMSIAVPSPTFPPTAYGGRRLSLQFTPSSPSFPSPVSPTVQPSPAIGSDNELGVEAFALRRNAQQEANRWERRQGKLLEELAPCNPQSLSDEMQENKILASSEPPQVPQSPPGLFTTLRLIWPLIPSKPLLFVGLVTCFLSGAMTPIFSFLLSRLMFEVSADPSNGNVINSYGGLVLGIAALDGLLLGTKYFLMEVSAIRWVTRLRNIAYVRVLCQDRAWFDMAAHAPAALAQVLVKDSDDARALLAVVLGQCVVVFTMMGFGILWAMVWGWQLTLVGIAIGPVFVAVMGIQAGLVAKYEVRNKKARQEAARVYYEVFSFRCDGKSGR